MSWHSGTEYIDSLVKDYLKFRGFSNTVKALESDLKTDKDKGFRIDKILQQLLLYVNTYDIIALKLYWTHLNSTFFCRFVKGYEGTIKRFETGLYRLYVVHAYQNSKQKELQSFFQLMAAEFEDAIEWKDWFILPFLQMAENNPTFAPYFTRQWSETFLVSLHNLLASLFSCMPVPDLVNACIDEGGRILKLEKENEVLKRKGNKDEFDFKSSDTCELPRYVEAMGNTGSLVDKTLIKNVSKKRPIFEFKTKYSAGNSSPKDSELTEKKVRGLEEKVTAGVNSDTMASASSPKLSVNKQQSKENVLLSNKFSKLEEERRALLGPKKKKESMNVSTIPVNKASLPTVSSSEEMSKASALMTDQHQKNMSSNTQRENTSSPSNGIEISYEKNIVLKKPLTQDRNGDSFAHSAVNDVVSSHDFVNNLHRLSLGEPYRSDKPKSEMNVNAPRTNVTYPNALLPQPAIVASRQPFLLLSKEVFLEHHSSILQCKFDDAGTTVGSIDAQGVVKVWKNSPRISTLATIMMNSPIKCLEWCSKPVDLLLLGTANGTIRLFDTTRNLTCEDVSIEEPQVCVTNIRSHPTGTSFITSSVKPLGSQQANQKTDGIGMLAVWDVRSSHVGLSRKIRREGSSEVTCMEFNHNGNLLITGDSNGNIAIYDMKTFSVINSWTTNRGRVCSLQFSHDETLVFSLSLDGTVLAWSLNLFSNHPIKLQYSDRSAVVQKGSAFALDPEGKHLLIPHGAKGFIFEIGLSSDILSPVLALPEHKSPVTAVDWTAINTCGHCLTGSSDGKIQISTLLIQS